MNSIKNVSHYSHEISSAEQTFTDILPLAFSSELIQNMAILTQYIVLLNEGSH